jgi:SOS-response transcriptional repressor LexA|uniref:Repressor protein CI n=1 Tax=Myoviridae sp. ctFYw8 TaxID=2825069 RepID=A0A8S5PBU3_9CAUD|nr:MAG TPA: Repressor protein CI [Myoviridae sp. ctFYw8]
MTINERFDQIIGTLFKGNKSAFANAIGVTPSVVDNIVGKRQGKPSFDVVEKVSALAEINIDWLITGKGDMLKSSKGIKPTKDGTGIPLIPVEAMAGCFTGSQTILLQECDHYVVPAFKNADFLIYVRGDSMQPRYFSGDMVACKMLSPTDLFFQWGKVYVLDTDQGALIKKVEQGTDDETITLVSENENYKPFQIPRRAVYHIAIVMGLIRTE